MHLRIFLAAGALSLAGGAYAQSTAQKSLNEGVCEELNAQGVTPGLYGLCVSYCEALECSETAGGGSPEPQCKAASPSILQRYYELKKETDPGIPCVKNSCPCWTSRELAVVGRKYSPLSHNLFQSLYVSEFQEQNALQETEFIPGPPDTVGWTQASINTYLDTAVPETTCMYVDAVIEPSKKNGISGTYRVQEITPEQGMACWEEVNTQAAALQSSGIPVICTGETCP